MVVKISSIAEVEQAIKVEKKFVIFIAFFSFLLTFTVKVSRKLKKAKP